MNEASNLGPIAKCTQNKDMETSNQSGQEVLSSSDQGHFKLPQTVGGGKADPPSKVKIKNAIERDSEEYKTRRNKNNEAVKKSREKSKLKGASTLENIERLKEENVELEKKVEVLNKELSVLKKLFMDHARAFSGGGAELPDLQELEKLLGHKLTDKLSTTSSNSKPSNSAER